MTSSDFNMLRLEAPKDVLQITQGTEPGDQALEITNPAAWVRAMIHQQRQAEQDLRQLTDLCGNTIDRTDQRIVNIEKAYDALAQGTRYVYDRVAANEEIASEWVRNELAVAANAYQTFAREVWQAIIERTQETNQKQVLLAVQLTRVNDALAFLGEANIARNQHLATFQGNVELWAAEHQAQVKELENQLQRAEGEIRRIATRVPLPVTPIPPASEASMPRQWRSPARRTSTTSLLNTLNQRRRIPHSPPLPPAPPAPLRNPFQPTTRRTRPAVVSTTPQPAQGPPEGTTGGPPAGPPRGPPRAPLSPPSRAPSPPGQRPTLSAQELIRPVAEGVTRAQQDVAPREERVRTSRLKMTNPETFDGKPSTSFSTWWKTVTKYLSFYPETGDQQRIAWVGTLLTGTAKAWDLHRYDTLGEGDSWVNYSAAIRAEYFDTREAANAQRKLSQLKYNGDIRSYFTEFRALNNYARATGEGLQEKVDLAMTSEILRMRFSHYLGEFADDEGFLNATYQVGLQVERMKALEKAREGRQRRTEEKKKETSREKDHAPKKEETRESNRPDRSNNQMPRKSSWFGKSDTWITADEAMKGVPNAEKEEYRQSREDCWRCGRGGHKTYECLAFNTRKGTVLPPAPWKAAAVTAGKKRPRMEESDDLPAKQQKVAAVEVMEQDVPQPGAI